MVKKAAAFSAAGSSARWLSRDDMRVWTSAVPAVLSTTLISMGIGAAPIDCYVERQRRSRTAARARLPEPAAGGARSWCSMWRLARGMDW